MAVIKPFKAIRPTEDFAERFVSLPYDVFDEDEARAYVEKHPDSFLKIDRAETNFPEGTDMYSEEVYEKASSLLWDHLDKGDLIREDKEIYYIYRLTMDGRSQTGIVGCALIDDYVNGVIKRHENTRSEKEKDRIDHISHTGAQTGPIFLAYRKNDALKRITSDVTDEDPIYDITTPDGIRHEVFVIEREEDINRIKEIFEKTESIYIADGHHRCASAVKVGLNKREEEGYKKGDESDYFLSVLFPDDELKIFDYNRVVHDLNGKEPESVVKELRTYFDITLTGDKGEFFKPSKKGEFGMYLDHSWFKLKIKSEYVSDDAVEGLDVSYLQKYCLKAIFDINDPKTDKRISFVGGIRGLKELEKRADACNGVAFSMYPTSIGELFEVADKGMLMPPKSTWFEPKLLSGFFIHDIRRGTNDQ